MPRYLFTVLSLLIFVLAFAYETSDHFFVHVSPETQLALRRETQSVKVGRSDDGALTIRELAKAPSVPVQARYANHSRTIRAFIAPDHAGVPAIYLEAIHPHHFYAVEGAFSVLPGEVSLTWPTPSTLMFYGREHDGALACFVVNVHELIITRELIDVLPPRDDRPVFDTGI